MNNTTDRGVSPELEKVASAIASADDLADRAWDDLPAHWQGSYLHFARAALQALREPTEGQYEALANLGKMWRELSSREVWQTYIDHVLGEPK